MDETRVEGSPFTRPWFLISGIFLVLGILAAIVVLVLVPSGSSPGGTAASSPDPAATSAAASAPPADAEESVCGLAAGAQSAPAEAPVAVWKVYDGVVVPTSPTAGPGVLVDEMIPTCFSHDGEGALFAAASLAGLGLAGHAQEAFQYLMVPGEQRDGFLATPMPRLTPTAAAVAGYQYLSYSPEVAVISVGYRAGNGSVFAIPMTLQWVEGDWKIVDPLQGGSAVASLDSYIPWGGA